VDMRKLEESFTARAIADEKETKQQLSALKAELREDEAKLYHEMRVTVRKGKSKVKKLLKKEVSAETALMAEKKADRLREQLQQFKEAEAAKEKAINDQLQGLKSEENTAIKIADPKILSRAAAAPATAAVDAKRKAELSHDIKAVDESERRAFAKESRRAASRHHPQQQQQQQQGGSEHAKAFAKHILPGQQQSEKKKAAAEAAAAAEAKTRAKAKAAAAAAAAAAASAEAKSKAEAAAKAKAKAKKKREEIEAAAEKLADAREKAAEAKEKAREDKKRALEKARKEKAAQEKQKEELHEEQLAKKKAEERKARCTAASCDPKAEDQALVADGPRLHRLIQLAEKGEGTQKAHALEVVKTLEKRVQEDFSSVMKFGQTQEHALDSDKVKHDTALALTGEVAHHAALKLEARNAAEVSSWMSSGDAL